MELLATHLKDGNERRFARLAHLAHLFDEYALRRPELLLSWTRGEDLDPDGSGGWQARLWLALRERIGVPSGAERLHPASDRLRCEPDLLALPQRFTVFGLTRLPAGQLQVLQALAAGREVHLMLLHPSPALWDKVSAMQLDRLPLRARDPTAEIGENRLLASWGRDSRELQLVLSAGGVADAHHAAAESEPTTLLQRLQADIHNDRRNSIPPTPPLPGSVDERLLLAADDDSVRIHSCHGRSRQVEVLREAILHRLAADPTLEPRDIIVMCPDIEAFAPLIQATFGTAGDGRRDAHRPAGTARGPLAATGQPAARRRREAARARARQAHRLGGPRPRRHRPGQAPVWSPRRRPDADANVGRRRRHPLGPRRQAPRGLQAREVEHGTWKPGLQPAASRRGDGAKPTGDCSGTCCRSTSIHSGDIELAGRFAELVERLGTALDALTVPHSVEVWARDLEAAVDALTATDDRDAWQRRELDRLLGDIAAESSHLDRADAPGDSGSARRPALGTSDPRQLPQRSPDGLHADADALGTPPRRLSARARRRRVPAQDRSRRRQHPAARAPGRRSRPALRGPPAVARCVARRARRADHHLQRQRRPHQSAADAGGPDRRAVRRDQRNSEVSGRRGRGEAGTDPAPAAAV